MNFILAFATICMVVLLIIYCVRYKWYYFRWWYYRFMLTKSKETDNALFKQLPPNEDCPICFLMLPSYDSGKRYYDCCGKEVCSGCIHAVEKRDKDAKCPFCRTPASRSNEERLNRVEKRMDAGDPLAIYNLGNCYCHGLHGLKKDDAKAFELWQQAAGLGQAGAYFQMSVTITNDATELIEINKAIYYIELAAMKGHVIARNNLGAYEATLGNMDRALKHWMIAIENGYDSLEQVRKLYSDGHATKDDYTKALRAYQAYMDEIKSAERDEAAAFSDNYKYY